MKSFNLIKNNIGSLFSGLRIENNVYMCRGSTEGTGFFNNDYNIKLFLLIGIFLLIYIDWKTKKRKDYLRILSTGTITWSLVELVLQLSKTRVMAQVYLFGWPIPLWLQIPFKGCVEGAGVAIFSIFFSDRVILARNKKEQLSWELLFGLLMALLFAWSFQNGIQKPNYGGDIPSRRAMIMPVSLTFLAIFSFIGLYWLIREKNSVLKRRGLYMLFFMIIYGTVWTLGEYLAGTRWIEIGELGSTIHAPPLIEFSALAFDVIVEIALVYLPFFAIPIMLGDIKADN